MGDAVGANGKEQRVTRQKGGHHETRFAENNREEDGVDPDAVGGDDMLETFVEMDEVFLKPMNVVHPAYEAGLPRPRNTRDGSSAGRFAISAAQTCIREILTRAAAGLRWIASSVRSARECGSWEA